MLSGSISCFKAAQVLSDLKKQGAEIQVLVSPGALQFIGEATLEGLSGREIIGNDFKKGHMMSHIDLVKWCDLAIVCPATAIKINELAHGVGHGIINSLFLAFDFSKPFLIAPAMNTKMLNHPATKKSLITLKSYGVDILDTGSGQLACGDIGEGRLLEPVDIIQRIDACLA